MRVSRQLTYFGIVFLFFLLSSIQVNITIPQLNFGVVAELKLVVKEKLVSRPVQSARFVFAKPKPTAVIFVGDVLLARNVEYLMVKKGADYPYQAIDFSDFALSSYVVGNFEASIKPDHIPTAALQMKFSVAEKYIKDLPRFGFTHFSLANNHSYDYGVKAYLNTKKILAESNLVSLGQPHDLSDQAVSYLSLDNKDIALVAINGLESTLSARALETLFADITKKSAFQIVYIHWGEEYVGINSLKQRQQAEKLVAAGADLIIGHHPHVIQNVDFISGVPVFYSLGNYIFDQYFSDKTQQGLLLSVDFSSVPLLNIIPVSSEEKKSQPKVMVAEDHQLLLKELAAISHPDLQKYIKQGVIPLDIEVATSSKIAMIN